MVVMLASTGETFVRRTVHSLAINTIQVLATSALLTHEQKQTLKYHLRHFSEARFQVSPPHLVAVRLSDCVAPPRLVAL